MDSCLDSMWMLQCCGQAETFLKNRTGLRSGPWTAITGHWERQALHFTSSTQVPNFPPAWVSPAAVTLPMHDLRSVSWLESCSFLKNQFFQLFLRQVIQLHIKLEGCFSYRLNNAKKYDYFNVTVLLNFMQSLYGWGKNLKMPFIKISLSSLQGRTLPISAMCALHISLPNFTSTTWSS